MMLTYISRDENDLNKLTSEIFFFTKDHALTLVCIITNQTFGQVRQWSDT